MRQTEIHWITNDANGQSILICAFISSRTPQDKLSRNRSIRYIDLTGLIDKSIVYVIFSSKQAPHLQSWIRSDDKINQGGSTRTTPPGRIQESRLLLLNEGLKILNSSSRPKHGQCPRKGWQEGNGELIRDLTRRGQVIHSKIHIRGIIRS